MIKAALIIIKKLQKTEIKSLDQQTAITDIVKTNSATILLLTDSENNNEDVKFANF